MRRRPSPTNVIAVALCAIAAMFTLIVRPTSFSSRGHETIAPLKAHATNVSRTESASPALESHVRADAGGGSPDALPPSITLPLPSVAPLAISELRPLTWIAWCDSPTRARADLMVFLN